MRIALALVAVATTGCGGDDDSTPGDGQGDASDPACERSCLVGSWIDVTGSCGALCTLSPAPAECAASDCQQANFYAFADGTYTLWSAAHSMSNRSFTLFTASPGSWALPSSCHLTLNASTDPGGSVFSCSDSTVDLPQRDYTRMSPELEQAVTTAAAGTLPVHATY